MTNDLDNHVRRLSVTPLACWPLPFRICSGLGRIFQATVTSCRLLQRRSSPFSFDPTLPDRQTGDNAHQHRCCCSRAHRAPTARMGEPSPPGQGAGGEGVGTASARARRAGRRAEESRTADALRRRHRRRHPLHPPTRLARGAPQHVQHRRRQMGPPARRRRLAHRGALRGVLALLPAYWRALKGLSIYFLGILSARMIRPPRVPLSRSRTHALTALVNSPPAPSRPLPSLLLDLVLRTTRPSASTRPLRPFPNPPPSRTSKRDRRCFQTVAVLPQTGKRNRKRPRISSLAEPTCHSSSRPSSAALPVLCCGSFLGRSSGGGVHCTLSALLVRRQHLSALLLYPDVIWPRAPLTAITDTGRRSPTTVPCFALDSRT
jgi:hypothetical protein